MKTCTKCRITKEDIAFKVRNDKKARESWCKICTQKAIYDWFRTHRIFVNQRKRTATLVLRNKLFKLLGGAKCSNPNCAVPGGMTDIRCLQFDHIFNDRSKKERDFHSFLIFWLKHPVAAKRSLQVLCANCNWIKREEIIEPNYARLFSWLFHKRDDIPVRIENWRQGRLDSELPFYR